MESFGGYIEQSWSERSREYSVSVCNVGTQLSLQRKALQSCEPSSSVADSNTPKIKATQCHRRLNLGSGVGPPLRLFPRSGLPPKNARASGFGPVSENPCLSGVGQTRDLVDLPYLHPWGWMVFQSLGERFLERTNEFIEA